ncbi:MAG: ribosomal protection-like ABC-F family protein [Nanoarchaeota archaeon]|nr:ATP-binding cassette domain-containing protein [Nanoarchaeota archaeon]MCG2723846.1 ATP-binding cassette domain-containing protein [archaeon]
MEYVNISGLKKSYDRPIFENANLSVNKGDRIALIGQNGRGKTTLIKIITGLEDYEGGTVRKKSNLLIVYAPQVWELDAKKTSRDVLKTMDARLAEINNILADPKTYEFQDRMNRVLVEYDTIVSSSRKPNEKRFYEILEAMGFQEEDYDLTISNLSSGQKTKLSLARALSQEGDFYILDEPTNHLDLPSREWLEDYLNKLDTLLMVSHDKQFINNVSNKIVELDDGRLKSYSGNYETYLEEKSKDLKRRTDLYEQQQEEVKRLRESARIKAIWVQQGAVKLGRTVRSIRKRADRLERGAIEKPRDTTGKMRLNLKEDKRGSTEMVEFENVSKGYKHRHIIDDFNEVIYRGDKIALLGPNGHGKSTLIKMILGEEPFEGSIKRGQNVKISYYDQELNTLNNEKTILDEIYVSSGSMDEGKARGLLASMLFKGDDVLKKIGKLSLGERSRVMLSKFMAERSNFLIIDEPLNNLDIVSGELLQRGLQNYDGTLLTVSHDRSFINGLCNKIWYLENGMIHTFNGNYDLFKEYYEE